MNYCIEKMRRADNLRFVMWKRGNTYFNIDGDIQWVLASELRALFDNAEFTEARGAFIDKLANPAEFASKTFGRRLTLPKELKLRAAMDELAGETK